MIVPHNALEVRGLSKSFGGLRALQSLDLDIRHGWIHGLIGPNGSGKSTAINVITGFLPATAGTVSLGGRGLSNDTPADARARMGLVRTFQITKLFNTATVEENVVWARFARTRSTVAGSLLHTRFFRREGAEQKEKARQLLERVGLEGREGLPAWTLSHGQQRRLEIAIALAVEPQVLVLDEPAAGVHAAEQTRLIALLRDLREHGVTTLIVEHNMRIIATICDFVTCLNFGKKLAEGHPNEILRDEAVIGAYLGGRARA